MTQIVWTIPKYNWTCINFDFKLKRMSCSIFFITDFSGYLTKMHNHIISPETSFKNLEIDPKLKFLMDFLLHFLIEK